MFRLTKWYLDCVTPEGCAFIAYSARLRWGLLRARYGATLLASPGEPLRERHTLRDQPPEQREGAITWRSRALGVTGRWCARAAPIQRCLLERPEGAVHWRGHQPSAYARIELPGRTLEGHGYVEELELTLPPWKIGMDVLRWGRFADDEHSVAWIEWGGDEPRRFVFHNGREDPEARVGSVSVVLPAASGELRLEAPRPLREGALGSVLAAVPFLSRLVPAGVAQAHESKRLSKSALLAGAEVVATGWAVHEVVTWR